MARRFITKQDIDALADAGRDLEVDGLMTITDLAREHARTRGVRIVPSGERAEPAAAPADPPTGPDLRSEVRAAVIAHLGAEPPGLDAVIDRVVSKS